MGIFSSYSTQPSLLCWQICRISELSPSLISIMAWAESCCSQRTLQYPCALPASVTGLSHIFRPSRSGCTCGLSRKIFFSLSRNNQPHIGAAQVAGQQSRSPFWAVLLFTYLSGVTSPMAVTDMINPFCEEQVSPPIRSTPYFRRRHIRLRKIHRVLPR